MLDMKSGEPTKGTGAMSFFQRVGMKVGLVHPVGQGEPTQPPGDIKPSEEIKPIAYNEGQQPAFGAEVGTFGTPVTPIETTSMLPPVDERTNTNPSPESSLPAQNPNNEKIA
jgi:hypothetical protein